MFSRKSWKTFIRAIAATSAVAMLAACGGGDSKSNDNSADGPALAIFAGAQTPIVANFNPYSPTSLAGTLGSLYEPLFYYNKAVAQAPIPLLGESYTWSNDGMSLDIKIRSGVKWNDGQDFTVDDVIYSFTNDAVKLDYINSVTSKDASTVTLTFTSPSYTNEYALLGANYIVPKHIFSKLSDLVTFANTDNPVGTGPFMLDTFTDASYTMKANPKYWDPERPKINKVQYLGINGNSSAESLFKAQQLDYSTMFVPDPAPLQADNRLGYLLLMSPNPITVLTCSNAQLGCTGAQTDKAVRKAFSLSLDRKEINDKAYYGHATIDTPTFTLPGRDDHWIKDGLPTRLPEHADVNAAKKVLEDAGYTLGADGIYAKDGVRASFKLASVEGWGDSNAAAELMAAHAKKAGIEVHTETVTLDQYTDMRQVGKYEMIVSALFGTPISDPYTIYRNCFTTNYTTAVGTPLEPKQTNFARYSNPVVDAAIARAAQTNDEAVKKQAYGEIQEAILDDLPYIPMFHGGSQTFYNQADFDGWPTKDNLYAFPASWDGISASYVLSHLTYK
ncbi:ABC transporter substrate-binding protein [Trueperella sp. LYQ143]|uniref:ABC transporter substrate-binding protein n=1 Tax=unclassified Trueperella TaxID=2630174 RepID=UPI00398389E9